VPFLYVVILDEAHRGCTTARRRTILQRFLLGNSEDGLCRMPLVIGVSATPRWFEELLLGTKHTVHKVYLD